MMESKEYSCSPGIVNKRRRTPNYSTQEKMILMDLVNKHKSIIENKKTNGTTWREKESSWIAIATEFNAVTPAGVFRDKESLKKCYENKKKEVRKVVAEEKRERRRTGGGGYVPKYQRDHCYGMVMEIANTKTILGLENSYDGDGMESSSEIDVNQGENESENDIEANENAEATFPANDEIITIVCNDNEHGRSSCDNLINEKENVKVDWTHYKAQDLKQPVPQNLSSWSSRRRPKVIEPVHTNILSKQYSDVASLKRKYFEQELEISKRKEERDVEEFQLRKKALLLDIALKEVQLQKLSN